MEARFALRHDINCLLATTIGEPSAKSGSSDNFLHGTVFVNL
jgi:hypothetical protein